MNEINNGNNEKRIIEKKFSQNFVIKAIDKRIAEQIEIGNVYELNKRFFLTKKGELYHQFFFFIHLIFNTDKFIINKSRYISTDSIATD
tara:strand:+ start:350 stop:616 length:267 start_codon:yes stop_codon:yes gene_type:complete